MLDSPVDEIKNRLDILDVIREYVNLEKAGSNYRALCPFHSEKSPSFFVSPSRQIWRCFGGCNDGGDMFKFIMRVEGVEFVDALRILAKKAGVELRKQNPKEESKKKRLFDICELSTLFFEKQLKSSSKSKELQEYLEKRGIKEESVQIWRVGYAPTAKDALSRFLIGKGYSQKEIAEAGVSVVKGSYCFDRFRGRLIFPIFNISGSPVAFGGRVVFKGDNRAKYINSPSTILYDKSDILYGMHRAKVGIRREKFAVIVEGYTDVMLSHQAGYENTVSSSGTALTSRQLSILRRYTENLFTAFDMDSAGGSATKKGIDLALKQGFDVKVMIMPKDTDPADLILENPKKWEESVKEARSVMDFYFHNALSLYDSDSAKGKRKIAETLLPEIKKIENSIERAHYVSKLANLLSVNEEAVANELSKVGKENKDKEAKEECKEAQKKTKREMLEERVVSICVKNETILSSLEEGEISAVRGSMFSLLSSLRKGVSEKELGEEERSILDHFSLLPDEGDTSGADKEVKICLREIRKIEIKDKLREIEEKIREAENKGNVEEEEELIKKFQNYSKELQKF